MSSQEKKPDVDHILNLLTRPLSRYILSVLAGVDPGAFAEAIETKDDILNDDIMNR
jgi:hypothetical protein